MVWRKMEILYYWWERKNVKWYSWCAKSLAIPPKLNLELPYEPVIPLLGIN